MMEEDARDAIRKIEHDIKVKTVQLKRVYSNDLVATAKYAAEYAKLQVALTEANNMVERIESSLKKSRMMMLQLAKLRDVIKAINA